MGRVLFNLFLCLVLAGPSALVFAASELNGFPVQLEGTVDTAPPLALDLDGDGRLELLLASRNKIHGLEADGSALPGYPIVLGGKTVVSTPLVLGRFSEQSQECFAFGTEDGALHIMSLDGKAMVGFPYAAGQKILGSPLFVDLHGKGQNSVLIALHGGRILAVNEQGRLEPGFSLSLDAQPSTTPTWASLSPGAEPVLIIGDERGRLHAWNRRGEVLPGFPYAAKYALVGQPILGDLDDDGRFEIIVGSQDFKVHAVTSKGKSLDGFPFATGYRIYGSCALADLDDDGIVEIVVASGDGKLYVIGGGGKVLKGFPVKVDRRLRASPVVGDLDADGRMEIAVGTEGKGLAVLRSNGKPYPGFPARLSDRIDVAPLMADLSGDGIGELVAVSRDGHLSAFRFLRKGQKGLGLVWPTPGGRADRLGRPVSHPARYVDLQLQPQSPRTTDELTLSYRFFDLDGEPEPQTRIRWFRNGKVVEKLDGARMVPAAQTRKHERWSYRLQAFEKGREFRSEEVRVANTPPSAPVVSLAPDPVRTRDDLQVRFDSESVDPDADRVRYSYAWLKNRKLQKGLNKGQVPARLLRKGDRWTAVVTPHDGEQAGGLSRVSVVVANTPPGAAQVELQPKRPAVTDHLRVVITRPAQDADGDEVSYRYDWRLDGVPLNVSRARAELPAAFGKKHAKLEVVVVSHDGEQEGDASQATVSIGNTAPAAPDVVVLPAAPRTQDDLFVRLLSPAADPDGDLLRYEYRWMKNGTAMSKESHNSDSISAANTRKGDKWAVMVRAHDDEAQGAEARAEVTVLNSPPRPARLALPANRLGTKDPLQVKILEAPLDPDGDKAWSEVRWISDGQVLVEGRDLFELPANKTRKHGLYEDHVVATDGLLRAKAQVLSFEVHNSPPGSCRIRLQPAAPKTGQGLMVELDGQVEDMDGDKLQMRYRWVVDGKTVEGQASASMPGKFVRRGQRWQVFGRADDGEALGPECSAGVKVENSSPSAPVIRLEPALPRVADTLTLQLVQNSSDPDGDELRLHTVWRVDGQKVARGSDLLALPAGLLRKGQRWTVSVSASDGELSSAEAVTEAIVVNSPPGQAQVEIFPGKPVSSDALNCRLVRPTTDPDGALVHHRFLWFEGQNTQVGHEGPVLPAEKTRRDQTWTCRVQTSDGTAEGPVSQASVQVLNACPLPPSVELSPGSPRAGDELRCRLIKPAVDPDGDELRYRFRWFKDGIEQSFAPGTDRVPSRLTKGDDIWQCMVVAGDGDLEGEAAESRELLIGK